jgi:uncharacterized protein YaiL (DUF2058 family)
MKKSIKTIVLSQIESDDGFNSLNNANIKKIYSNSDQELKNTIDNIFINLCGYSLDYIIINSQENTSHQSNNELHLNIEPNTSLI